MTTFDQEQHDLFAALLEFDWLMLRSSIAKWRSEHLPGARAECRYQVRRYIIGVRHNRAQLAKLDALT